MTKLNKNYRIIFKGKDGKCEYTTQTMYYNIIKDSSNPVNKAFVVNGNRYLFEDIKRMQEPHKKQVNQIDRMIQDKTPDRRLRALKNMAKGVKGYITTGAFKGTDGPELLLEKMRVSYSKNLKLNKQ